MNGLWVFISSAIVDAGLRSFFLIGLVLVSLLLLRRVNGATRHLVLLLAFISLLAMPVLNRVMPKVSIVPSPIPRMSVQSAAQNEPRVGPAPILRLEEPLVPPIHSISGNSPKLSKMILPSGQKDPFQIQRWVVVIWAAGAVVALLPLTLGCMSLLRLSRRASRVNKPETLVLLEQLKDQLGIKRNIQLLEHPSRRIPMTWGLSPTILLPSGTEAWPHQQLRQVLLHELAHVRRLDFQTRLFGHCIRALYWFNPLVWLALARLIAEQENASDDLVLEQGTNPVDYVENIFRLISTSPSPWAESNAAVGMARVRQIEARLQLILDPERNRQALRGWVIGVVSVIFLGVVLPLALADTKGPDQKLATSEMPLPQRPAELHQSAVQVVVGTNSITFEGKETTWEELPLLLSRVQNRNQRILELAVNTDTLTLRQLNEAQAGVDRLRGESGFREMRYVGVHTQKHQDIKETKAAEATSPKRAATSEPEPASARLGQLQQKVTQAAYRVTRIQELQTLGPETDSALENLRAALSAPSIKAEINTLRADQIREQLERMEGMYSRMETLVESGLEPRPSLESVGEEIELLKAELSQDKKRLAEIQLQRAAKKVQQLSEAVREAPSSNIPESSAPTVHFYSSNSNQLRQAKIELEMRKLEFELLKK
ncbi:MAG: peptidase BlaR1 [Verrucomicrobiales bacterium]|nr:peptidase BlaR1 [Verrucomicrobiales bacterium]